ncbi:histidine kinase, partial [Streptomyces sp. SID5789]|nr:histidine kinase [Streptomyces sp. SID5789]
GSASDGSVDPAGPTARPRPVPASRAEPAAPAAPAAAASASAAASGPNGLAPLPRRVPQTSLAAELRDEDTADGRDDAPDDYADFTAEHAASSLGGFQRGTLRAQADAAQDDTDGQVFSSATPSTPTADRRPPTKDTR